MSSDLTDLLHVISSFCSEPSMLWSSVNYFSLLNFSQCNDSFLFFTLQ
uniref:Uncharacterized protein n=1 Tax=Rhizophora mucronata TaxID=61149 RepID=A0A2P2Q8K1_RHIMU